MTMRSKRKGASRAPQGAGRGGEAAVASGGDKSAWVKGSGNKAAKAPGSADRRPGLGPNAPLLGAPRSRQALATPALIVDLNAFEHNLKSMARLCKRAGLALRPHAKTHKSIEVARRQIAAGAVGISVATVREAAVMVEAGLPGVLLTTPVVGDIKLDIVRGLAGRSKDFMVAVDTLAGVEALERGGRKLTVLVDLDIGMTRTGVPDIGGALALIRRVQSSKVLKLAGVQAYSGMVQHIKLVADRENVYGAQLTHLQAVLQAAGTELGYKPDIVTGGGTGSFDIDRRAGLFTECQCGSYVFMDVQYEDVQLSSTGPNPFKTALFVQCTVISNNHPTSPTTDGGFKTFSMDGPIPRLARGVSPQAVYKYFGDEFGKVSGEELPLGAKVELVTPHCDPTVNMHDFFHCVRGNVLEEIWRVDARGSL
ncbi:MAG: DSD1 family PLP-dependent enzyme [Proteobacteria bacterium]|nr:DSD1 family PLP-dependent enzyme [Pseudomonadota bacterium]